MTATASTVEARVFLSAQNLFTNRGDGWKSDFEVLFFQLKADNKILDVTTEPVSVELMGYTPPVYYEHALIAAFVKRGKRDRYREILSNPRLRHKFTDQLAHFKDFDPKYRLSIPSNKLFTENIAIELRKRHSPNIVFAISEDHALDQKELPLVEALKEIVGSGMGTVLSCIPGRLAFVETEDERFILERHNPLEKSVYIRFVIGRKDEDIGIVRMLEKDDPGRVFSVIPLGYEVRLPPGVNVPEPVFQKFDRAMKTQVRPVLVSLQRMPFRDFTASEFLGRTIINCLPPRSCHSVFRDSTFNLGHMADACVYFGQNAEIDTNPKPAR